MVKNQNDIVSVVIKEVHDKLLAVKLLLFYEEKASGEKYGLICNLYNAVTSFINYEINNQNNG